MRAEYEELKTQGVELIHPGHPDFPPHLLEIAPMLFIKERRKLSYFRWGCNRWISECVGYGDPRCTDARR